MIHRHRLIPACLGLLFAAATATADVVTIAPSKDNTLYEDPSGGLSNGAGVHLFAGKAGVLRRGLLAFDVAASVPAGSTIQGAQLQLYCSRSPLTMPPPALTSIHAVTANWGEGASNAGEPGGNGDAAATGDATWIHTFFNSTLWTNPGGDYVALASATTIVGTIGFYTWGSTAAMVADVQTWLDTPGSNYGWILIGDEATTANARRFETREQTVEPTLRPALTIEYATGPVAVESQAWATVKNLYR